MKNGKCSTTWCYAASPKKTTKMSDAELKRATVDSFFLELVPRTNRWLLKCWTEMFGFACHWNNMLSSWTFNIERNNKAMQQNHSISPMSSNRLTGKNIKQPPPSRQTIVFGLPSFLLARRARSHPKSSYGIAARPFHLQIWLGHRAEVVTRFFQQKKFPFCLESALPQKV